MEQLNAEQEQKNKAVCLNFPLDLYIIHKDKTEKN